MAKRERQFMTMHPDGASIYGPGDLSCTIRWNILTFPVLPAVRTRHKLGDFNDDGSVNVEDYNVWRDNLGAATETALNGNGSNSGGVDIADYTIWKNNFGASASTASLASSPVPEPSTILLLLGFVVAFRFSNRTIPG